MSPLLNVTAWTPLGPAPIETAGGLGPISGRVQAAAPDPTNAGILYIGADNGGVWKKAGSPGWTPLTDFQPSLNFNGYHPLVVHPKDSNLVLGVVAGTPGGGLLKSADGGATWQLLATQFDSESMQAIAVDPTDVLTLYVSTGWSGAWKSTDGGLTWNQLTGLPTTGFLSDLIVAKFDSNTLYAAVVANTGANQVLNGVYRSTDGGSTWQLLSALPSGAALSEPNGQSAVRLESGTGWGVVYAAVLPFGPNPSPPPSEAVLPVQRYRTIDGGTTWTALAPSPGNPETRSWHLLIGVDPGNDNHIFANDAYSLFESSDAGITWSQADAGIGYLSGLNSFDWVNIAFDVNRDAVLTADQGPFRYVPTAGTWTSLIDDLQVSEFYTITIDPRDSGILYAVGQDIFTETATGALQWTVIGDGLLGETGKILVDPTNSNRLCDFNPLSLASNNFVLQSFDAGATWNTIFPSTALSASFLSWYGPKGNYTFAYPAQRSFAMDQTNPERLLVAADQIFETTNATNPSPAWSAISGVLSGDPSNPYVTALAIAPSDGNVVYAATPDGHVWVTYDDGAHWATCDAGLLGTVRDLRIDPNDANHAFAVTDGGVWELQPSSFWANKTGNIPNVLGFHSIFVDWRPAVPGLFVGTTRGVYRSVNLGATWTKFSPGLPNTTVWDLQGRVSDTDPNLRVVVAGTYGRGAWGILVPPWGAIATAIINGGNFGTACVGSFADQLLTINNIGSGPLLITGITSSSPDFGVPDVLWYPLVVSPGGSIDVVIRFQPGTFGPKPAILTVISNDPSGPHTIHVTGQCAPPALSLAIADAGSFGPACIGNFTDKPLIVNNRGSCVLSISGITSSSAEFLVPEVLNFPLSVAPGESLPVPIRFEPTSFGAQPATLTVSSNDPTGPHTIAVFGVAPSGALAVTGSTFFGGVELCHAAERTLEICNTGDCALRVTSVAFKRKSRYWKLINDPFPATLHPGSCLGLVIRYWAAERYARACELVIASDDPAAPERTLDLRAYTIWGACQCKSCCDDCRKGCCEKPHRACCGTCHDECCDGSDDDL